MSLAVENILGIIDRDGEEELALDLSSFLCGVNDEIQTFLTDKAIEFARKKMSITYLVSDDERTWCLKPTWSNDCKNYSPQVLKANMKIVGATEYALVLYRGKLPKFRNTDEDGRTHMLFNWFDWKRDGKEYPKIHPSQKLVSVLKRLIEIFTDPGDVVIDPCAGSGSTLRAAKEPGRHSYSFEVSTEFCRKAKEQMIGRYTLLYLTLCSRVE